MTSMHNGSAEAGKRASAKRSSARRRTAKAPSRRAATQGVALSEPGRGEVRLGPPAPRRRGPRGGRKRARYTGGFQVCAAPAPGGIVIRPTPWPEADQEWLDEAAWLSEMPFLAEAMEDHRLALAPVLAAIWRRRGTTALQQRVGRWMLGSFAAGATAALLLVAVL